MKPLRENLILYVNTRSTGVFECADRVKNVCRFAKSAPAVNQQRDTYYSTNALSGCDHFV
jgi:hypothetical protein